MILRWSTLVLLSLVGLLVLLVPSSAAPVKPSRRSVRVLYLVPKDRAIRADYRKAIEKGVLDLQVWYYAHLNGKTFRLNDPIVEVRKTARPAAWYNDNVPRNRPEKQFNTFYNAMDEASTLFGARADDPRYVWLVYIDAPGGTGAGTKGVAILPDHDLQGLIGKAKDKLPVPRWIGGSGHELGHAFGLPHTGNLHPNAIMQFGYLRYLNIRRTESMDKPVDSLLAKDSLLVDAEKAATKGIRPKIMVVTAPRKGGFPCGRCYRRCKC